MTTLQFLLIILTNFILNVRNIYSITEKIFLQPRTIEPKKVRHNWDFMLMAMSV
jgi:hypothetical protein